MADVSNTLVAWSSTSASNNPSGGTAVGTGLDDNIRELQGVVVRGLSNKGSDIASAATTDLGAVEGLSHSITGTTTITSFGTVRQGIWKIVIFSGALTLTHNATSLILPGAANITTAAGDVGLFQSEGSGNWRCHGYLKSALAPGVANSLPATIISGQTEDTSPDLASDYLLSYDASASALKKVLFGRLGVGVLGTEQSASGTALDFTGIPSWATRIYINLAGISLNGTANLLIQLGDSGGVEGAGYNGAGASVANGASGSVSVSTAGFLIPLGSAAGNISGTLVLVLENASSFNWCGMGVFGRSDAASISWVGATKATSAALDRVRLTTTNGTDAFDAGVVNILYS